MNTYQATELGMTVTESTISEARDWTPAITVLREVFNIHDLSHALTALVHNPELVNQVFAILDEPEADTEKITPEALNLHEVDRAIQEGEKAMINPELITNEWVSPEVNMGTTESPIIRKEFAEAVTNFVDRLPNTFFLGKHVVEIHDSIEAHDNWERSLWLRRFEVICRPCHLVYNKNLPACPSCNS